VYRAAFLAFCAFMAEQRIHIRGSNVIVELRHYSAPDRPHARRDARHDLQAGQSAERSWRRLRGFEWLAKVVKGVKFSNGVQVKMKTRVSPKNQPTRAAA
jgi:putative transposase